MTSTYFLSQTSHTSLLYLPPFPSFKKKDKNIYEKEKKKNNEFSCENRGI